MQAKANIKDWGKKAEYAMNGLNFWVERLYRLEARWSAGERE